MRGLHFVVLLNLRETSDRLNHIEYSNICSSFCESFCKG
jgi:hypothetical protein